MIETSSGAESEGAPALQIKKDKNGACLWGSIVYLSSMPEGLTIRQLLPSLAKAAWHEMMKAFSNPEDSSTKGHPRAMSALSVVNLVFFSSSRRQDKHATNVVLSEEKLPSKIKAAMDECWREIVVSPADQDHPQGASAHFHDGQCAEIHAFARYLEQCGTQAEHQTSQPSENLPEILVSTYGLEGKSKRERRKEPCKDNVEQTQFGCERLLRKLSIRDVGEQIYIVDWSRVKIVPVD